VYRSLIRNTTKDRFSLSLAINLFYIGLKRLSRNILKYNKRYTREFILLADDEYKDTPTAELEVKSTSVLNSSIILTSILEPPSEIFID